MHKLTGIYWIKDEARYLPEYIEFHLLQGFDHFIFYDNNSTDNTYDVLSPYIESNLVEIRTYPSNVVGSKNFWLMEHCCAEQQNKSEWIHFHSVDERIFCPDGRSISELLLEYKTYGGLCVAWQEFNFNGHRTRPEGLIIENYTTALQEDPWHHVKTIVQPGRALGPNGNPHNFVFKQPYYAVTENYFQINGAHTNPENYSYSRIKNHHYRTLSEAEFLNKMNKGVLDTVHTENIYRADAQAQWNYCIGNSENPWGVTPLIVNAELLKFVVPVRLAIQNRYLNKEYLLEYINH
jgi:hypothetical protein